MNETAEDHARNTGHAVLAIIQQDEVDQTMHVQWSCTHCGAFGLDEFPLST